MALESLYCQYSCCIGKMRYVIVFLGLLSLIIHYCQRTCFSIGLQVMTDEEIYSVPCKHKAEPITKEHKTGPKVHWSENEQGYNLASFYISYTLAQIPMGWLCDSYGAKYPLMMGLFLSSLCTAAIPLCTLEPDIWWIGFILRFIIGLGQSVIYPGLASLLSRWIPPYQLSLMASIVFGSTAIGVALGHIISILIINLRNWPRMFYYWGIIGGCFIPVTWIYIFSDPTTHPRINFSELNYLKGNMVLKVKKRLPFREIFRDKCIYGLIIIQVAHDLVIVTLTDNLPIYLRKILGITIRDNLIVSAFFLIHFLTSIASGIVADNMVNKKNFNIFTVRVVLTGISTFCAFASFSFAILSECKERQALIFFCCSLILSGCFYAGGKTHIIEISINHAGFVMGVVNGIGTIASPVLIFFMGLFSSEGQILHWQIIIGLVGALQIFNLIFYMFLSPAQRRNWDYDESENLLRGPVRAGKRWYLEKPESQFQLKMTNRNQIENLRKQEEQEAKERLKNKENP